MTCPHLEAIEAGLETAFTVDASRVTFGAGSLREVGERARAHGIRRAALVTDATMRGLDWFDEVEASLRAAAIEICVFDAAAIEPTDASLDEAIRFARDARVDGYVSIGGGSVIDTAKAANLYATHPAELRRYVNAPLGDGLAVPGPLAPHLACPTTAGTGSEVTGIAIFDWLAHHAKTGIASMRLRPTEAIVDPRCTRTLPAGVVAASGMDVLCHAVESFTARPFTKRTVTKARPASQGANPWSDVGCREALRFCGAHLANAVAGDNLAREQMMWAATLAGIAFGNAGVHVPHAMAYAVGGLVHGPHATAPVPARSNPVAIHAAAVDEFRMPGYPDVPLVPHGAAVAVNAPAVFRATATSSPERHLEAAALLGADVRGIGPVDGGELLARTVIELMRAIGVPNGIGGIGYTTAHIPALVDGAFPQQRLLANAPCAIGRDELTQLFERALEYW